MWRLGLLDEKYVKGPWWQYKFSTYSEMAVYAPQLKQGYYSLRVDMAVRECCKAKVVGITLIM